MGQYFNDDLEELRGGYDEPKMTAKQAHEMDERLRMEEEARQEDEVLCRTCKEQPVGSDGDRDFDQCLECRYETP